MITPELKNFGTLFDNYSFRVPNYQRSYEWKQQAEIDDFWLDLFDYYERKKTNPNIDGSLFLGSLILFKIQGKKDSYEIVDGQQRITTLFILLIAIRNLLDDFIEQGVVAKNKDGIEIQFKMIRDKRNVSFPI